MVRVRFRVMIWVMVRVRFRVRIRNNEHYALLGITSLQNNEIVGLKVCDIPLHPLGTE